MKQSILSWFRNVILILTASPAPHPESRRISCAWAKFLAARRALVKKERAVSTVRGVTRCTNNLPENINLKIEWVSHENLSQVSVSKLKFDLGPPKHEAGVLLAVFSLVN
jgi:hypothetical protein